MTVPRRRSVPVLMMVLLALGAVRASAALSPAHADFAQGPAQWLMTNEEKSAWRSVSSDEQAERFIQLFWARRDPTPGTPRNEFKEDFDARVATADKAYRFKEKRGSLTDMGRVFILLGPPANFAEVSGSKLENAALEVSESGSTLSDVTGMQSFDYGNRSRELGLVGPVKFAENLSTHEYRIDFQHGNVAGALNQAVRRAVVSPKLNEVPEWAKPQVQAAPAAATATIGAGQTIVTTEATSTGSVKKTTKILNANTPVATEPAGAKTLVLTKDVFAINPQGTADPLASVTSSGAFAPQDELGFAAQYCAGTWSERTPTLKEQVTITGAGADGKRIRMTGAEEEMTPDAIRSMPGCYLVRGSLPLADVAPGAYKLTIRITDPASGTSYSLDRDFAVQ
jgi:GWxTD domain-containing protein